MQDNLNSPLTEPLTWWNITKIATLYVDEKRKAYKGNRDVSDVQYIKHQAEHRTADNYRMNQPFDIKKGLQSNDEELISFAFSLLQKLVCIKLSKMGEHHFWKNCVINLIYCLRYQAQIQNTYNQLKPNEKLPTPQPPNSPTPELPNSQTPQIKTFKDFITKYSQYKNLAFALIKETETELHFSEALSEKKIQIIEGCTGKTVIANKLEDIQKEYGIPIDITTVKTHCNVSPA